jgi:uncharacterized protein YjbI with pentapeptide repeats
MKLTTQQIQKIIKEELEKVLEENISAESLIPKLLNVLREKKPSSVDKALTKARIQHLFRYKFRGTESEREFADKWIRIFYKDFPMFKQIVDGNYLLKVSMDPTEFNPAQPNVIDPTDSTYVANFPEYEGGLGVSEKERERAERERRIKRRERQLQKKAIEKNKKNFQNANLPGVDFANIFIHYGNFQKANLRGAYLSDARITGTNFDGADMRLVKLETNNFVYETIFNRADLSRSTLTGTRFMSADFIGAKLIKANLQNSSVQYGNLSGADLSQANLRNCEFYKCNLRGANFKDAILKATSFKASEYDDTTIWPANFKPERRGAIKK